MISNVKFESFNPQPLGTYELLTCGVPHLLKRSSNAIRVSHDSVKSLTPTSGPRGVRQKQAKMK